MSEPNELEVLGRKYGTDKVSKHHYGPVYFDLFHNNSKRRNVKKVLEIGPAEGAGIKMFRDFFPNATIYGAEIDQNRVDKLQGLDRIEVYHCDQSKESDLVELLKRTGTNIDLVIDDGSHDPKHQLFTCLILMTYLDKGVTYIIEDVAHPEIEKQLAQYNTRLLEVGKRYDDKLIIVRHK